MAANHVPGTIVEFGYRDRPVRFFVRNMRDIVQGTIASGSFYEIETLTVIERYLKPGGVFVDIGSNVGNHAIYVAMFCQPGAVVLIEPNPEALMLLRLNLLLNKLELDTRHLGVGLSDRARTVAAETPANNLGGTRMVEADGGSLRLVTGDSLFAGRQVDFLKIDVEGLELEVLAGLAATLAACRPRMFIEIGEENREGFKAWLHANAYDVAHAFPRYPRTQNVIVRPREVAAP